MGNFFGSSTTDILTGTDHRSGDLTDERIYGDHPLGNSGMGHGLSLIHIFLYAAGYAAAGHHIHKPYCILPLAESGLRDGKATGQQ